MSLSTPTRLSSLPRIPSPTAADGYAAATEPHVRLGRQALARWPDGKAVALTDAPKAVRDEAARVVASHGGQARVEVRRVQADGRDFLATRVSSGRTTDIVPYGSVYDAAGARLSDYEELDGRRFFYPSPAEQQFDGRVASQIQQLFRPRELGTVKLKAKEANDGAVAALLAKDLPKEPSHAHGSKTYRFELEGTTYYARFHAQGTLVELTPTWGGPPRFETAGPSLSLFDDRGRSIGQWTVDARGDGFGWNTVRHAWGHD